MVFILSQSPLSDLKAVIEASLFNEYDNNLMQFEEERQQIPSFTLISQLLDSITTGSCSPDFQQSFIEQFSQFPILEYFRILQDLVLLYILQFTPIIRKFIIDTAFTEENISWITNSNYYFSLEYDSLYFLFRLLVGSQFNTIRRQDLRFYTFSVDTEEDDFYEHHIKFLDAITFNEDTNYILSLDSIGTSLSKFNDICLKLLGLTLLCHFSAQVPDSISELLQEVNNYGPHDLFFKLQYAEKFPDYPHNLLHTMKQTCQFFDFPLILPLNYELKYFEISLIDSDKKILYDTQAFIAGIEKLLSVEDSGIALEALNYIIPFYKSVKHEFNTSSLSSFPDNYDVIYTSLIERRDYPANKYWETIIDGTLAFIFKLAEKLSNKNNRMKLFELLHYFLP